MLLTASLILALGCLYAKAECVDGKDNVIEIYDLLEDKAKIRFSNVSIAVYGEKKSPLCSKSGPFIQLPGYLKFVSGQVEVVEPIEFKKGELKIQFTSEHSSFFIGQVCLNGESANAFVPDDICEKDFCELIDTERCQHLTKKQTMDVHQLYDGYFELPEMEISEIGGEWKAEASLSVNGNEIARIRVGKASDWIQVQINEKEVKEEL